MPNQGLIRDLAVLVVVYLLGSLPFAYLVTRLRTGQDIRQLGEGNAGARNVYHVVGPVWGVLVAVFDIGKGWVAYHASRALGASELAVLLSGFAVVSGHNFPFLRWKEGGKGVSTTMGFLLGMLPRSTAAAMMLGLLAQLTLRDANRTLVIACAALALMPLAFGEPPLVCGYVMALLLTMAAKKVIDLQHERQVWSLSGWSDGATPGFYREGTTEQTQRRGADKL